jgi:hypothetical protein
MKAKTAKGDPLAKTDIVLLRPLSPLARVNLPSLQETAEPTGSGKDQDPTCKESLVVEEGKLIERSLAEGDSDDESESLLFDYRVPGNSDPAIPRTTKRRPLTAILA